MNTSAIPPAAQPFEETFRTWVAASLAEAIPTVVKAFVFNLLEYGETPSGRFGIELVGTGIFDEDDSDWACYEVWEPSVRRLEIPLGFSGSSWEECLERVTSLLMTGLNSPDLGPKLKQGAAIGIGFVDGDLSVAWQR
ncbi:hypothetical protein [Variovorax paradoxus]|uniref:hypothetical protein n=1 Tax=Variovorax paradoxus TaxID=34073 RepID=UPI003D65CC91